jgi:hypothetical protein
VISTKVSQTINVHLSPSDAKDVAIKYICAVFDWKTSYSIRADGDNGEDWVFHKTTVYSSHSFETEFRLRKATERDKMICQFIEEMKNT